MSEIGGDHRSESGERVRFQSDEFSIAGLLFRAEVARAPAVAICQGTVGVKEHYRFPELAAAFAAAGITSLIFDYRGMGESEGPEGRFMPAEQARDVRNAVSFLASLAEVDEDRIGLVGYCWGGPHAVFVGSTDPRVKAVAEVVGMSDGTRWLRSLRRYSEWQEFVDRLVSDRSQRARTGESERVAMGEVLVGSPTAKLGRELILSEIAPPGIPYRNPDLTLEAVDGILDYAPEQVVPQLSPRPLLVIHAERDDLVPLDEATALYEAAGEPKELEVYPGAYHHDVYLDPLFGRIRDRLIEWLQRALMPPKVAR